MLVPRSSLGKEDKLRTLIVRELFILLLSLADSKKMSPLEGQNIKLLPRRQETTLLCPVTNVVQRVLLKMYGLL